MDKPERKDTAQRALVYAGIAIAVVVVLVLLWYALDVVLLAFLGILFAILLRTPADWLSRRTGLRESWSLALVGGTLLGALAVGGFLFGRAVAAQAVGLAYRIPEILADLRERIAGNELGARLIDIAESSGAFTGGDMEFLGKGLGLIGSTFGALANLAIIIFFGAFMAARPRLYTEGLLKLVALRRRPRVRETLHAIGHTLQRWLVAQALLAVIVAVLAGAGLLFIGVPFAIPLALLAGLMEFVPYIGPFIAAIPALLVAVAEGSDVVLWTALLYLAVQSVESYILAPLAQQRAVELPPAMILFAQVLMGVIAGGLGVAVATPLAAAVMVALTMLYVEDVLGDRTEAESSRST